MLFGALAGAGGLDRPKKRDPGSGEEKLARMAAGEMPLDGLRLEVFWNHDSPNLPSQMRPESKFDVRIAVAGDGYGLLNDKVEFQLSKDQLRQIAKWLDEADILLGEDGGREFRDVTGPDGKVTRVFHPIIGRINLQVHGTGVGRIQFRDHAGPPDLARLGNRLVNSCLEAGRMGVGADSVADGLTKIRKKQLRPGNLRVEVCRALGAEARPAQSVLEMKGSHCQWHTRSGKAGSSFLVSGWDCGPEARDEVAELLHDILGGGVTPKFFAPLPTTIRVTVLDKSVDLVGDRFLGLGTAPATQDRFDRLCELLELLEQKVQKKGQVLPLFG